MQIVWKTRMHKFFPEIKTQQNYKTHNQGFYQSKSGAINQKIDEATI